jgi:hypothetical protein
MSTTHRLTALHVSSLIPYASGDVGSGRCRLPRPMMLKRNIKIGSILVINVADKMSILCTAWPDTHELLEETSICVDDTVVYGAGSRITHPWTELECEVQEVRKGTFPVNAVIILSIPLSRLRRCLVQQF